MTDKGDQPSGGETTWKKHWRDIICHGTACWYIRPCTRYWACPMMIIMMMTFLLIRLIIYLLYIYYITSIKLFLNYIGPCSWLLIYMCSTVPLEISSLICRSSQLCCIIPPGASCNPSSKICFVIPWFATPSFVSNIRFSVFISHSKQYWFKVLCPCFPNFRIVHQCRIFTQDMRQGWLS